jgi:hypothetical protein
VDKKLREYFRRLAKRGGIARATKLTKAQRHSSAQKAARARWADTKEEPYPLPGKRAREADKKGSGGKS